jgi:hypothetical protein
VDVNVAAYLSAEQSQQSPSPAPEGTRTQREERPCQGPGETACLLSPTPLAHASIGVNVDSHLVLSSSFLYDSLFGDVPRPHSIARVNHEARMLANGGIVYGIVVGDN